MVGRSPLNCVLPKVIGNNDLGIEEDIEVVTEISFKCC